MKRERNVTIPMQSNGKESRNGRTLNRISFSPPPYPFASYSLAVAEMNRDKD